MRNLPAIALLLLAAAGLGAAEPAHPSVAESADPRARTLILVNSRQPESVALGEFYAARRGIPPANLVALPMPAEETITWRAFVDGIWQPLQDELFRRGWLKGIAGSSLDPAGRKHVSITGHGIAYLVVCRGTPLRVENDPVLLGHSKLARVPEQFRTNQGAVDSELGLMALGNYDTAAFVTNPLYNRARPAGLDGELIVKVARLDGPSFADARRIVTSALEGECHGLLGRYYVDLKGPHPDGDHWLGAVRRQLDEAGFDGDVDETASTFGPAARFDAPVLYFGWYAGALNGPFAREGFAFPPGAIAFHLYSFSAATLRSTTEGWAGPLVSRGAAAVVGNVFEPYLQLTHRPDLMLETLLRGGTLGDAACSAMPVLSWQSILIGDPLYRPFAVQPGAQREMRAQLPPALAPYLDIREARLLERAGRTAEARALLQAALRREPGLPLALAQAQMALRAGDKAGVVESLAFMRAVSEYRAADWPLGRAAADLLARNGGGAAALQVYEALARSPAPDGGSRLAMLHDARDAADAAGDMARSLEFARLANEGAAVPPAPGK